MRQTNVNLVFFATFGRAVVKLFKRDWVDLNYLPSLAEQNALLQEPTAAPEVPVFNEAAAAEPKTDEDEKDLDI